MKAEDEKQPLVLLSYQLLTARRTLLAFSEQGLTYGLELVTKILSPQPLIDNLTT